MKVTLILSSQETEFADRVCENLNNHPDFVLSELANKHDMGDGGMEYDIVENPGYHSHENETHYIVWDDRLPSFALYRKEAG